MSKPTLYMHHGYLVTATERMRELYPDATLYVRLTDHEAARAADKARIAELEDAGREALSVIQRLRPERAGMGTIVRLQSALAQQGKEGEA